MMKSCVTRGKGKNSTNEEVFAFPYCSSISTGGIDKVITKALPQQQHPMADANFRPINQCSRRLKKFYERKFGKDSEQGYTKTVLRGSAFNQLLMLVTCTGWRRDVKGKFA